MPGLRLLLLGSPRLEREEKPLKLSRRKAVALLAYLAVTGEAHQRETLAVLFWPDHDQSRAHANLRRDLSVLNKTLGDGWLQIDRESVRLAQRDGFWLDVEHFRRLLAAYETHEHPADEVCSDCIPLLTEAVALYRGDFTAGFTLPDSPDFDEWQFFEAEALRCELAGALSRLMRGLSTLGEFEAAIPYARRWLALESWHELAHRELMRLYAWSGQRAAALRQYRECVRVLDQELGQPPENITRELYQAIQTKQPPAAPLGAEEKRGRREEEKDSIVLKDFPPAPLPPSPSAHQHNLPPQPTAFIGREQELRGIGQLLLDEPDCRMLTLVGPGGIGKTRLAIQAGMEALTAFPDGVYLVSLAPVSSPEFLVPSIADALALSFEGADPKAQLLNYLRQKEMLLVLDNFEHLLSPPLSSPPQGGIERGKIGGGNLLSDVLTSTSGIKLLVTSRERLNLQWEWVRDIEGLTYPSVEEMGLPIEEIGPPTGEAAGEAATGRISLEGYSAVRLFVENARRSRPDFSISEADNPAVARICQLVEGMPLGLELASAWVRIMPPQEIAQEIERNLDFLTTSTRDMPERHRSLRALFEHSWQLLSKAERSVIRGLSVFRGSFGREAAQKVAGASLPLLAALVDKSMLRGHPTGRYDMHELLRQYAAEKLQQKPKESEAARDRHGSHYAAFLQAQEPHLRRARRSEALAEIGADVDNLRAAWQRAVARGRATEIGQSLESLHLFYFAQGWFREGEEAFREAASGLKSRANSKDERGPSSSREDRLVLGQVLVRQGLFSSRLGLYREARECLQESLVVLQQLEAEGHPSARRESAFTLYHLGEVAWRDGEYQEAKRRPAGNG
jgi:predicted ATPase/DNA-binding SARP family transcriptional activator